MIDNICGFTIRYLAISIIFYVLLIAASGSRSLDVFELSVWSVLLTGYAHILPKLVVFYRKFYGLSDRPKVMAKREPMTSLFTETFKINGQSLMFMYFNGDIFLCLDHDNANELINDPDVEIIFEHFEPMVKFKHHFYAYSDPADVFKLYDIPELETLSQNPLLTDRERAYVTHYTKRYKNELIDRMPGYVYLIQADLPDRPCKIGRSKNVPQRLKIFGIKLPFDTKLLHTIPCADYIAAERELHKRYAHCRRDGEWFDLSDDDIEEIRSIEKL